MAFRLNCFIYYAYSIVIACTLLLLYILSNVNPPVARLTVTQQQRKEGYLIWTPSCQIPDIDLYHQSILRFLHQDEPYECSRVPPLTYTSKDNAGNNFLKIDTAVIELYTPEDQQMSCCYSVISRYNVPPGVRAPQKPDDLYNISECLEFGHEVLLSPEEEFTLVRCGYYMSTQNRTRREVYVNTHAVIPIKPNVRPKLGARRPNEDDEQFNVLLVGIDSLSRQNFLRAMPRTVAHLNRNGWVNLKGYNKIGKNTLPNLVSVLTGLSIQQLKKRCWRNKKDTFDNCPFIWKDFHNRSYITAYAEDDPNSGPFNYRRSGFAHPPTDYFLRPYMLASLKELPTKTRHNSHVCMGPTSVTDILLRYTIDFATTFRHSFYFALFWVNNFSHNSLNYPKTIDLRYLQFFNELTKTGALNTSFIVFFSDHGQRVGKFRETSIGWFEDRLPFIYLWIPEWFRIRYPIYFQNLLTNSDRLTSPYDIHCTLRFILHRFQNNSTSAYHNVTVVSEKFKNLLSEEIEDRPCEDAGIEVPWCACIQYETLSVKNEIVQAAARFVVEEIRMKLKIAGSAHEEAKLCAELRMNRVIEARKIIPGHKEDVTHNDYIVIVETFPGGGLFEATVRYQNRYRFQRKFVIMGEVSRVNFYRDQSTCVDDSEVKLFCYCITKD